MSGPERGRKRPTALGSNSTRFATAPGPDGTKLKIPQAKDSLTALYIATPEGGWPETHTLLLAYNETELTTGFVTRIRELRPGHGMDSLTAVRVMEVQLEIERWTAQYARVKRFVLLELMPDVAGQMALTPDELENL